MVPRPPGHLKPGQRQGGVLAHICSVDADNGVAARHGEPAAGRLGAGGLRVAHVRPLRVDVGGDKYRVPGIAELRLGGDKYRVPGIARPGIASELRNCVSPELCL